MQFQGRELHIGDKLMSKLHGEITVESMQRKSFTATSPREGILCAWDYAWDYEGRRCYVDDQSIDATWPEASSEVAPSANQTLYDRVIDFMDSCKPLSPDIQREAEYRRIWIERAARLFDGDIYVEMIKDGTARDLAMSAFDAADAFLAELKRRDGEGL